MMRNLVALFILITLASCSNWMRQEAQKTGKSSAASGRINASESSSQNIFNELD